MVLDFEGGLYSVLVVGILLILLLLPSVGGELTDAPALTPDF